MNASAELRKVSVWQRVLGLLPVPLFDQGSTNQHVLLNGSQGNFCLEIAENERPDLETSRAYAWSSNVGHYVTVTGDNVEVQRWDLSRSSLERYTASSVHYNLEKFHEFLQAHSPNQEMSIVAHSIRFFRKIRATLGKEFDGIQGLKVFLFFLASATDENPDRDSLDLGGWHLTTEIQSLAKSISASNWESLIAEFLQGRKVDELMPKLSLVLRHASGQIFQDAHYEAVFLNPNQLMLSGFLPSPVQVSGKSSIVGVHFTPPSLARTLVEESLRHLDLQNAHITIFDPACGSGEFLREALRQLKIRNYQGRITIIGWDISEAACDMARFEIGWELRSAAFQVDMNIEQRDSISVDAQWPEDVDLVLMNPPFVTWNNMNSAMKESTRLALGALADKKPNLALAFVHKASNAVKRNGVLGAVIPSSFLDGVSAIDLREDLARQFFPVLLARLGSQHLFANATVDVGLYVAKRGDAEEIPLNFWADFHADSSSAGLRALRKIRIERDLSSLPKFTDHYSIYPYSDSFQKPRDWSPRPYKSWILLKSLEGMPRVKDLFDVKQGIKTGLHKAFVLSKDEYLSLPKNERKYFRPAIMNGSIRAGFIKENAYAFFPYGKLRFTSQSQLRSSLPIYFKTYLLPNEALLLKRSGVDKNRWWEYTRHRAWLVEPKPKIVSTQFGDAGSFGLDLTGKFVCIDATSWLPIEETRASSFSTDIGFAYLAILNSDVFSQLLAASSTHLSGGQWSLTKQYVDNIAIPDLFSSKENILIDGLAQIGKLIYEGLPVKGQDLQNQMKLVNQAYGIVSNS